jgi:hypothetical protein
MLHHHMAQLENPKTKKVSYIKLNMLHHHMAQLENPKTKKVSYIKIKKRLIILDIADYEKHLTISII